MSIDARDISVRIGRKVIVSGVTLTAVAGQVTAIVGPNGSGKTTLLRAISGDLGHEGMLSLNGRPIAGMRPWEAAGMRAVLPQSTALAFPFTVREVVALGLTAGHAGVDRGELDLLPDMALERVDLSGFSGRFYQELSGGEQQRVQLARVLCQVWQPVLDGQPRWLLLDEPVSSLDIRHQIIIMDIARDFALGGGGVVAVLHDLNLTAMYADRIAAMNKGRLAACGTPAEVLTDELISTVFECPLGVGRVPPPGVPFVLPQSAF